MCVAFTVCYTGRRKVETLLQRMFEDEIEPDDIGTQDLPEETVPRKYTLDSVVS